MTTGDTPPVLNTTRPTSVRYSLHRVDILRWQLWHLIRNRLLIAFVVIFSIGAAWINLRAPDMAAHPTGFKILYVVIFTALMFCFVGIVQLVFLLCQLAFRKYRGFLGEHELEIRDEGLAERTRFNESLHRWSGFHKVVSTRRYLYIYVTDTNFHIVPKRCFASEKEAGAFRDEIERRFNVAS